MARVPARVKKLREPLAPGSSRRFRRERPGIRGTELAKALETRFHGPWFALPALSIEDPHKRWDLIATAGFSGRASEAGWGERIAEQSELLLCFPSDLAELSGDQPHRVSDSEESNRLLGQLWRAAEATGDSMDFSERTDPSNFVCRGGGACQLGGAVTADSAGVPGFGRSFSPRAAELGLTMGECGSMGPRAKQRGVAENACSMEQIAQFTQCSAEPSLIC